MKELLELLAVQGGKIVCSASLTPEEINTAREEHRMCVDDSGIGYVYVNEPDYEQKFRECFALLEKVFNEFSLGYLSSMTDEEHAEVEQFIKANRL